MSPARTLAGVGLSVPGYSRDPRPRTSSGHPVEPPPREVRHRRQLLARHAAASHRHGCGGAPGSTTTTEVALRPPGAIRVASSGRLDPATGRHVAVGARSFGLFIGKGYDVAEADAGGVLVRALFTPAGRPCAELLLRTAVDAIGFYRGRFGFYPQAQLSIVPG